MGQLTDKWDKILRFFYDFSEQAFTIRELAKRTGLPKSSVQRYVRELRRLGLLDENNRAVQSFLFKTKKMMYYVELLVTSGLIEHLIQKLNPSCIILFGSIRKGDSTGESDIDLFVETHLKKEVSLAHFEKKLGHPVQLHREQDIHTLPPQLFNNVVNGIKLYGSFKVK